MWRPKTATLPLKSAGDIKDTERINCIHVVQNSGRRMDLYLQKKKNFKKNNTFILAEEFKTTVLPIY